MTQAEKDCGLDEVNLERAAGPELILQAFLKTAVRLVWPGWNQICLQMSSLLQAHYVTMDVI